MIKRFVKITPNLYRGSAPSPKDVLWLKQNYNINKIVSLDQESGEKINRACKILNIDHVKLYIGRNREELINFLTKDFKKVFLEGGPVFFHCLFGKDRSGLAAAIIKCRFFNMDPEEAILEAKSLGFGIGVSPKVTELFEKIIRSCKPEKDINNVDIVSNEREYIGDNRDSFLDEGHQGSFSPYLGTTKQYPIDFVYNDINNQPLTRENYYNKLENKDEGNIIPQVGLFNNDAGINGSGFVEQVGGFIYD